MLVQDGVGNKREPLKLGFLVAKKDKKPRVYARGFFETHCVPAALYYGRFIPTLTRGVFALLL